MCQQNTDKYIQQNISQLVTFGIVLFFEQGQDCNYPSKANGTIRDHHLTLILLNINLTWPTGGNIDLNWLNFMQQPLF